MARVRQEILITQSLFDRLCDEKLLALGDVKEWPETRKDSIAMFKQSLRRDVEWLLNTRKPVVPGVESYPLTSASVLCFGLPDARVFHGNGGRDPETLKLLLRQCLEEFEPRIQRPQVSISFTDRLNRSLRFHVEGVVRYEDMEEEIQLDTVLKLISGEYEVD